MSYYIGFDLGGTNIKAVAVDEKGHLLGERTCPTRDGEFAEDGSPQFALEIRQLLGQFSF